MEWDCLNCSHATLRDMATSQMQCNLADAYRKLNDDIQASNYQKRIGDLLVSYTRDDSGVVRTDCFQFDKDGTIAAYLGGYAPPVQPIRPSQHIWKETDEYWIIIAKQIGKLKLLEIVWKDRHDPLKRIKLEE